MTRRVWLQLGGALLVALLLGYLLGASWQPWHPFKVAIWGTVGQWASTVLSTVSIFLVLYVIFRDRSREVRKQASQIFVGMEWRQPAREGDAAGGGTVTLTVYNPTDAPIREVMVEYSPYPGRWPTKVLNQFGFTYTANEYQAPHVRIINPDNYTSGMNIVSPKSADVKFYVNIPWTELIPAFRSGEQQTQPKLSFRTVLSFYDINNRHWLIDSEDSKLKQITSKDQNIYQQRKNKLRAENEPLAKALAERIKGSTIEP